MPLTASLIAGGVNLGLGAYKTYQARKGLKNLAGQPMPQYSLSPELSSAYNMAQQNANQGYSGEETAAFKSNLAQNNNSGYQRAKDMSGGSLSGAINAGVNYGNIGALNQFAAQGNQIKRQNQNTFYGLAGQVQGQRNMNTQAQLQHRQQLESAYGNALSQGLNSISSGLGTVGAGTVGKFGGNASSGFGDLNNNQYNNLLGETKFNPNDYNTDTSEVNIS